MTTHYKGDQIKEEEMQETISIYEEDEDKCTQNFDQKRDVYRDILGDVDINGKKIVKK
jgi:hypothetical protein